MHCEKSFINERYLKLHANIHSTGFMSMCIFVGRHSWLLCGLDRVASMTSARSLYNSASAVGPLSLRFVDGVW